MQLKAKAWLWAPGQPFVHAQNFILHGKSEKNFGQKLCLIQKSASCYELGKFVSQVITTQSVTSLSVDPVFPPFLPTHQMPLKG